MRKILFIAATHGNERDGVKVMRQLEKELPREEYGYEWVIGNERAFEANVRFTEQDLNRSAPGDINSPIYEVRRAAELIEYGKNFDVVIDLHGTKTDSGIVVIVPLPNAANMDLATSVGLQRVVLWYSQKSQTAGPLVQHMPVPAIEFECGPRGTKKAFEMAYAAVRRLVEANKAGRAAVADGGVELYGVYGKLFGEHDPSLRDFKLAKKDGELFYPPLSGDEYSGIVCYKMKKIDNYQEKYDDNSENNTIYRTV